MLKNKNKNKNKKNSLAQSRRTVWVKDSFMGPWTVNVHFALPHVPTWHDVFSLFPEFPYCGQNEGAGGAMP